jgi:hypothetical protein
MAGLGRKVFAPGEVLTATNVQNYLMDQAVQVYAGTAARGSAIGSATTEGMVSYLADSNVVQAYDGSAWNSLAYSSAVIIPGLIPIAPSSVNYSSGTATANSLGLVTFTGVSSVSLNGIFTSSYLRYEVVFSGTNSAGGTNFQFRYRAGGVDASAANTYFAASYRMRSDSSTFINAGSSNAEIILSGGSSSSTNFAGRATINDVAVSGTKTLHTGQHTVLETNTLNYFMNTGSHTQGTSAYDGLTFYPGGGTFTGTIQVFGYND